MGAILSWGLFGEVLLEWGATLSEGSLEWESHEWGPLEWGPFDWGPS
jgi:hypothetical protein